MYTYDIQGRAGKKFKGSNFCLLAKQNFYLRSFATMPTLMCEHMHFYNLNAQLVMCACSRKVDAVLLAAFVLFLSPAVHNLDRNRDRNNTSYFSLPFAIEMYGRPFCFQAIPTQRVLPYSLIIELIHLHLPLQSCLYSFDLIFISFYKIISKSFL